MREPAPYPASIGCCGATSKEDCVRPPCPCNLSAYSPDERAAADRERTERIAKPR